MQALRNHLVLIGFKHVGKSVIGNRLAKKLGVSYIELDQHLEQMYQKQFFIKRSCRQIMQSHGEAFFRQLEIKVLRRIVGVKPSVIALGGGTPLAFENQRLLKKCILVHITAPQGIVFERIAINGRPAFIDAKDNLLESFDKLWTERMEIYEKINDFSIENNSSIDDTVNKIINKINLEDKCA